LVLEGAPSGDNIFYRLCPSFLLLPLVVLATIATIIASQSIITGAFSMTRQAIQLGWLPRLHITQTSAEGYGQIYVGSVNWLLLVTLGLTVGFGKSDNLASACGIAVSMTMLMTSVLCSSPCARSGVGLVAGVVAGPSCLSTAFFVANFAKVAQVDTCRSSWLRSFTASCSFGMSGDRGFARLRTRSCPSYLHGEVAGRPPRCLALRSS
jgi:KUP system potassium uptake protein